MNNCGYCGTEMGSKQGFCSSCGKQGISEKPRVEDRITKSQNEKIIAGVCGGIAEHYGWDPTMVRLAFIIFSLMGGSGVLLYLILILVIPEAKVPYKQ